MNSKILIDLAESLIKELRYLIDELQQDTEPEPAPEPAPEATDGRLEFDDVIITYSTLAALRALVINEHGEARFYQALDAVYPSALELEDLPRHRYAEMLQALKAQIR